MPKLHRMSKSLQCMPGHLRRITKAPAQGTTLQVELLVQSCAEAASAAHFWYSIHPAMAHATGHSSR